MISLKTHQIQILRYVLCKMTDVTEIPNTYKLTNPKMLNDIQYTPCLVLRSLIIYYASRHNIFCAHTSSIHDHPVRTKKSQYVGRCWYLGRIAARGDHLLPVKAESSAVDHIVLRETQLHPRRAGLRQVGWWTD